MSLITKASDYSHLVRRAVLPQSRRGITNVAGNNY
jgi:hypothetical protein